MHARQWLLRTNIARRLSPQRRTATSKLEANRTHAQGRRNANGSVWRECPRETRWNEWCKSLPFNDCCSIVFVRSLESAKIDANEKKKNNWSQVIHIRLVFVCAFSPFDIKWQYAAARRHIQTLMDGNGNWKEIERGIFNASGAAQFRIIPDSSEHCSFESPLKFHGCRRKNAFAGAQTPHRHLSFRALFPFSLFVCESVWLTQLSHEPHSIQLVRWTSKARKECTTFTCRRFEIRARQWDTPSSLSSLIWSH